VRYGEAVG